MNRMCPYKTISINFQMVVLISTLCVFLSVSGCATLSAPNVPTQNKPAATADGSQTDIDISGKKTAAETAPKVTPPKSIALWVPKGSGTFTIDDQRLFHGIGGSKSSSNPILLRASADNRSREKLEDIISQFIRFVVNTYWNKDGGRQSSDVGNLQLLKDTFMAAARDTLAKSRIAGHWQDPKSGEFYSLCQFPLSDLIAAMANDTRLDQRSREYFLKNAERLYDLFSKGGVESS